MFSFYGIFISISCLVVIFVTELIARKNNLRSDLVWSGGFWAVIFGLIGARFYHVLHYASYYSLDPRNIFKIWEGGLGIIGGLITGGLALYIFLRSKNQDIGKWLDIVSIPLPLGQAIGRLGNLVNMENFGAPTNLPWGVYVPVNVRPIEYLQFERFHPVFLYESILCIILFLYQFMLYSKKGYYIGKGEFFKRYLVGYASIRFMLEFLRINTWKIGFLNMAQLISILILSICFYTFFKRHESIHIK